VVINNLLTNEYNVALNNRYLSNTHSTHNIYIYTYIQSDYKVPVNLMITVRKHEEIF
jgi:hypothetical protein